MEDLEKLAILTAAKKVLDERIKEVRASVDFEFAQQHETYGVEKIGLKVAGEKVGELILTYHKDGFTITDQEAFNDFALAYGLATTKRSIRPEMLGAAIKVIEGAVEPDHIRDFVQEEVIVSADWENYMVRAGDSVLFLDSGMEVPGVRYRPKVEKGTQVRGCKPEQVVPILQGLPGGLNDLLLGGE